MDWCQWTEKNHINILIFLVLSLTGNWIHVPPLGSVLADHRAFQHKEGNYYEAE